MACNFSMRASIRLGRIGAAISPGSPIFSQDRFADAVASLEKIDLQSNDF